MNYEMFAVSSPGPKYSKKGWPCQDSASYCNFGHVQVIAVADGHGSADCFRSQTGSGIAVEAAFRQLKRYCGEEAFDMEEPALFSRVGIENFKYDFLEDWKRTVREHWDRELDTHAQLGEGEIRFRDVSDKYRRRYLSDDPAVVNRYLYTAYGTTLLLAVSIGTQILLLQIGDGTCVVLQRDGTFVLPVPPDEDNFLNVTVSLCEENAFQKFRYAVLDCDPASPAAPAAVFLSTDGVDDCFPVYKNEEHLYKLYTLIVESILKEGSRATYEDITQSLLPVMTSRGSRDDISIAFFTTENKEELREAFDRIDPVYRPPAEAPCMDQEIVAEEKTEVPCTDQETGEEEEAVVACTDQETGTEEKTECPEDPEGPVREKAVRKEEIPGDEKQEEAVPKEDGADDIFTAEKNCDEESVLYPEEGEEGQNDHHGQHGAV
ncbi:MAG: PP2C family serine/threonine-protein phosphatase [Eubacteriales bacterium]|nr:PP2C family serine/threonine-protein phosphatase [Eubacteriales bacterium]